MSQLFYLSAKQLERIKPFFPLSHGIPRVDDLKVISGIIYVIKHGLQWKAFRFSHPDYNRKTFSSKTVRCTTVPW